MDTPMSDKTHVEPDAVVTEASRKLGKEKELEEAHVDCVPAEEDVFPEGGRGWLVVFGCMIYGATTLGWAYVIHLACARLPCSALTFSLACGVLDG